MAHKARILCSAIVGPTCRPLFFTPPSPYQFRRGATAAAEMSDASALYGGEEMDSAGAAKPEEVAAYQSTEAKQARLQSMLAALLDDPILADVPRKPSLGDVDTLINLELGSAMRVNVVKLDNTSFDVAVLNTATVKDLKLALRKKITEIEQGQMGHRHISWKHIWENYCLTHQSEKLIDDNSVLSSYGIRNNSKVCFSPHVMSRVHQKHSRRRKHRFFHGLSRKL